MKLSIPLDKSFHNVILVWMYPNMKGKISIVIDPLEEYFGKQPDMPFKKDLAYHAKKIGKSGLSILGDIGPYPYKSMYKELVKYELSLPTK